MSCKFALAENGFYVCTKVQDMDLCMFDEKPDSKRCSEMYGIYSKESTKENDSVEGITEESFDGNIEE